MTRKEGAVEEEKGSSVKEKVDEVEYRESDNGFRSGDGVVWDDLGPVGSWPVDDHKLAGSRTIDSNGELVLSAGESIDSLSALEVSKLDAEQPVDREVAEP